MTQTVEIPVEVAEVAARELNILIDETNELEEGIDYPGAMTPLARAYLRITNLSGDGMDPFTLRNVEQTMVGVSEDTGCDMTPNDPLQDDVFRARDALEDALIED